MNGRCETVPANVFLIMALAGLFVVGLSLVIAWKHPPTGRPGHRPAREPRDIAPPSALAIRERTLTTRQALPSALAHSPAPDVPVAPQLMEDIEALRRLNERHYSTTQMLLEIVAVQITSSAEIGVLEEDELPNKEAR